MFVVYLDPLFPPFALDPLSSLPVVVASQEVIEYSLSAAWTGLVCVLFLSHMLSYISHGTEPLQQLLLRQFRQGKGSLSPRLESFIVRTFSWMFGGSLLSAVLCRALERVESSVNDVREIKMTVVIGNVRILCTNPTSRSNHGENELTV